MSAEAPSRPLLLGHRGCRLRPFHENTRSAFDHALRSGCDGFEFDVRLTSDQKCVCIHDPAVSGIEVDQASYGDIYKQFINSEAAHGAGSSRGASARITCLPEVLEAYAHSAFLNVELKVPGMERTLLQLLKQHEPTRGYVVSSFIPEVICDLAELAPEILGHNAELGYLFDTVTGLQNWPHMPGPWIIPRQDLVTRQFIDSVHSAGRKVLTWTVNRPTDMIRFRDWGIDGLISDDPALLSHTVRG